MRININSTTKAATGEGEERGAKTIKRETRDKAEEMTGNKQRRQAEQRGRNRGVANLRNWEKTKDKANGLTLQSTVSKDSTVDCAP